MSSSASSSVPASVTSSEAYYSAPSASASTVDSSTLVAEAIFFNFSISSGYSTYAPLPKAMCQYKNFPSNEG